MPALQLTGLQENVLLKPYTTFKIGGPARFLCRADSADAMVQALQAAARAELPQLVLGEGSNVLIADAGPNRWLMYGAMGFESLTSGMGTGAFSVLLLRMTMKQFSATQYALFSSLFALPRILAGPVTGVMVDAAGWSQFFWFTIAVGIPGLLMLQRFAPLGTREPEIETLAEIRPLRLTRAGLFGRALLGGALAFAFAAVCMALLDAVKHRRLVPAEGFDLLTPLQALFRPEDVSGWVSLFGVSLFSIVLALATAATAVARSKKS